MDKKIIDLHDEYSKGDLDRRQFIRKLSLIAGGTAAATALIPALENNYAKAETVSINTPMFDTGYITYPGETGDMRAYYARPAVDVKLPGVMVIHENRGLNPHIEDVARRMALAGFVVIAPDALSPVGGTPADTDEARGKFRELDGGDTIKNFVAAVQYLKTHPQATGKVGCIGFCWGGRMTNQVAVNSPDLSAAAPYYGSQPSAEDVPKIRAALLLHYAGNDTRINAGIEAFEAELRKNNKEFTTHVYEGASHAFNNDTNAARYHKEAATLAWERTIKFMNEKLK